MRSCNAFGGSMFSMEGLESRRMFSANPTPGADDAIHGHHGGRDAVHLEKEHGPEVEAGDDNGHTGNDDPAGHNANDTRGRGKDDPAGHNANDDRGRRGGK